MATAVTEGLIRDLARFRAGNGCAVSIYVDLDPSALPTIPDEHTKLNSALDQAQKATEELAEARGRDCKLALRADFERLRSWVQDDFTRDGARGLAIFA